ncbi:hypothetical protein H310_12933 [Aphanomyces invadans]|uniref:WRKY19-like zinc finger domain-containing protein n=1 Tax=Aphanomyces invadans TaxID=157072 RepID=A0A024TH83_9STRA|nr:hypothetical protein H310_12933 [Aphanomyces invadans]ETV92926.1 hypothetical protein H310_12933 [Aphanomyces invadans]|eukprot:XP_008878449.1 hypothetical protein H310_12933 [Aphanomyces invadans]
MATSMFNLDDEARNLVYGDDDDEEQMTEKTSSGVDKPLVKRGASCTFSGGATSTLKQEGYASRTAVADFAPMPYVRSTTHARARNTAGRKSAIIPTAPTCPWARLACATPMDRVDVARKRVARNSMQVGGSAWRMVVGVCARWIFVRRSNTAAGTATNMPQSPSAAQKVAPAWTLAIRFASGMVEATRARHLDVPRKIKARAIASLMAAAIFARHKGAWNHRSHRIKSSTLSIGWARCNKVNRGGGHCKAHGGGKKCADASCKNWVLGGGWCKDHGGGSAAVPRSTGKRCTKPGCTKYNQGGGYCLAHGGGVECSEVGCTKKQTRFGLCSGHGGKARCNVEGCDKISQTKGLCKAHGGVKACSTLNCTRQAKARGLCIAHGGGAKCRHPNGCDKAQRAGGLCNAHTRLNAHGNASYGNQEGHQPTGTDSATLAIQSAQSAHGAPPSTRMLSGATSSTRHHLVPPPTSSTLPAFPTTSALHHHHQNQPTLVQFSTAVSILHPSNATISILNPEPSEDDPAADDSTAPAQLLPTATSLTTVTTSSSNTLTHLLDSCLPYMYSLPSLRMDGLLPSVPSAAAPDEVVRSHGLQHQLNPIDDLIHPTTQDAALTMTSLW